MLQGPVSLEQAARVLLDSDSEDSKLKTKVRRLYDIANIFQSLGMIAKMHLAETRKPAFQWIYSVEVYLCMHVHMCGRVCAAHEFHTSQSGVASWQIIVLCRFDSDVIQTRHPLHPAYATLR